MKKAHMGILLVFLVFSIILQTGLSYKVHAAGTGITDLSDCSSYSREAVKSLASTGVTMGDGDRRFNSKGLLTRAQAVTFIVKLAGFPTMEPVHQSFNDVSPGDWSFPYVETAYAAGLTAGTSRTTFSPDAYCTREEFVTMLMKSGSLSAETLANTESQKMLDALSDAVQISPWAKRPMAEAYSLEIISGWNKRIAPREYASREQAAVILNNYRNLYASTLPSASGQTPVPDASLLGKSVVSIISFDKEHSQIAQGSGFCVGKGLILTNYHVVDYGVNFSVETYSGIRFFEQIGVVAYDREKDWAILKVPGLDKVGMPVLTLGSMSALAQGDVVMAVGSPYGLPNTLSEGIVSAERTMNGVTYIQTTAPVTFGSSGGPLFDMQGRVAGIISSGYEQGSLHFALPVDYVQKTVSALNRLTLDKIRPLDLSGVYAEGKSKIAAAVKSNLAEWFDALEREDTDAIKALLDPASTVHGYTGISLGPLFEIYDLAYDLEDIKVEHQTGHSVQAQATYRVRKVNGPAYRDSIMHTAFKLTLIGGKWLISERIDSVIRYLDDGTIVQTDPLDLPITDKTASISIPLDLRITDAVSDPDRPVIYISDKQAKKVYAVNYETHNISEMSFSLMPERMAFSRGKLYVALLTREHDWQRPYDNQHGAVAMIDADTFKLAKTLTVAIDPFGIAVDNAGHIYISSGSGQHGGIKSFSESDGALISKSRSVSDGSLIKLNPASGNLYVFIDSEPDSVILFHTDAYGRFTDEMDVKRHYTDEDLSANFHVSPDGQHVFNGAGFISFASLNHMMTMPNGFVDMDFDPEHNLFYAGMAGNFITAYDDDSFQPVYRFNAGGKIERLFYREHALAVIINSGGKLHMKAFKLR